MEKIKMLDGWANFNGPVAGLVFKNGVAESDEPMRLRRFKNWAKCSGCPYEISQPKKKRKKAK